jgi:protein-tyrosine phosphatase/arsenate reductase
MIYSEINDFIKKAIEKFDTIPQERMILLQEIASYIEQSLDNNGKANLLYVCIHNSRRSQFGQIWAQVAASYFGHYNVHTYSGGSEATALSLHVVEVLNEIGLKIEKDGEIKNPHYSIRYDDHQPAIHCFSKKYTDAVNPKQEFCAVKTCTQTDDHCPDVNEADLIITTTYEDRKKFEGDSTSPSESSHAERNKEIATECLYIFSKIEKSMPLYYQSKIKSYPYETI